MTITINSVEVNVIDGTLAIDDAIGERSTASFVVKTATGTHYSQGQPVEIYNDATLIFAGVVDSSSESNFAGTTTIFHSITCKDWHYLVDKRVLGKSYTDTILTNAVTNPSFENGATGWALAGPASVVSTASKFDAYAMYQAATESPGAYCYQNFTAILGHKYYYSAWCKNTKNNIISCDGANNILFPANSSVFVFGSAAIYTAPDSSPHSINVGYNSVVSNGAGAWVDGVSLIDLTAAYGAGYEPTKAWCDANINYSAGTYELQKTTGEIVNHILKLKLADESITAGTISDGVSVDEAVFNYDKVTNCLDTLAEKSGYIWYIDFDKKLYFIPRETNTAPWTITEDDVLTGIKVNNGNPEYRNTQIIRGGVELTDAQTETFKGDGALRAFNVGYKTSKVPTITLNAAAQTVGIRGLDTGKNWYWSKGETAISQDEAGTVLISTDTLSVTYQGEYPIVVISGDGAEIEGRKTIEGNSGINEAVSDEPNSPSRDACFQLASAKLEKYAAVGRKITFRTMTAGLEAGQIATITFPSYEINGEYLIENVNITENAGYLYYDISAVEGPELGSWTNLFKKMIDRSQNISIYQNISEEQVLVTVEVFSKTWTAVENPNIFREVYPSATLYPSATTFPMFALTDRVKYISFLDSSNTEVFRKAITTQTGTILSVVYISPQELNQTVEKVAWYGGTKATSTLGTGIKVDEQAYAKTKVDTESLQVEKTDTKWA